MIRKTERTERDGEHKKTWWMIKKGLRKWKWGRTQNNVMNEKKTEILFKGKNTK